MDAKDFERLHLDMKVQESFAAMMLAIKRWIDAINERAKADK